MTIIIFNVFHVQTTGLYYQILDSAKNTLVFFKDLTEDKKKVLNGDTDGPEL